MTPSPLPFDFARSPRCGPRLGRTMLLASVLVLVFSVGQLARAWSAQSRETRALAKLEARAVASSAAASRPIRSDASEVARIRAAREIADSLTTPWSDLLESLEDAPQQSVALLAVEPSVSKQSIRLTAEARDQTAMIDYLGALQRDKRLTSVVLVSHLVEVQAPGAPVRFQLQAGWGSAL